MKRYRSDSFIAFNILIDGKRKRIRFEPLTKGGSYFQTSDEKVIAEMERMTVFKTLFVLEREFDCEEDKEENGNDDTNTKGGENDNGENGNGQDVGVADPVRAAVMGAGVNVNNSGLTVMDEIDNAADAKAFLVSEGAAVRNLSSKAKIREVGEAMGYLFPNMK